MQEEPNSEELEQDLICVAIIGGTDTVARSIIEKELSAANIVHHIEGSVVYNVLVPRSDVSRALDVLRKSKELKKRWHQLVG